MKFLQTKKTLISLFLLFSILLVPFLVSFDYAPSNSPAPAFPATDECIFSMEELCEYFKCYVMAEYDNVTEINAYEIGGGAYITSRSSNMNQTRLNGVYNAQYGTSFSGTCAEVAMAQILYHFTTEQYQDHSFIHAMNIARGLNYFPASNIGGTKGEGTIGESEKEILTDGFSFYNTSYVGNLDKVNLMSTIKSEIDAGRPVLTYVARDNVNGATERVAHDVVAVGYTMIHVPYKRLVRQFGFFGSWITKDYAATFDVLVVNNGWVDGNNTSSDYYIYRYYPATLLDNSYIVKVR